MQSVNIYIPWLYSTFRRDEIPSDLDLKLNTGLLSTLLAKADVHTGYHNYQAINFISQFPIAQLELDLFYTHKSGQCLVLCLEPVHMQIHTDHIVVMPVDDDQAHVSSDLVEVLNKHFIDELHFKMNQDGRLYCLSEKNLNVTFTPAYDVYGRNAMHFMPKGDDAAYWRSIINEIQMLLYQYSSDDKQLDYNAFWLWGNGIENYPVLQGAIAGKSRWIGSYCSLQKIPRINIEDISGLDQDTVHYIVDQLIVPGSKLNFSAWKQQLVDLEDNILLKLYELLRSGDINEINLIINEELVYRLKRNHRYRFLRKKIDLLEFSIIQ